VRQSVSLGAKWPTPSCEDLVADPGLRNRPCGHGPGSSSAPLWRARGTELGRSPRPREGARHGLLDIADSARPAPNCSWPFWGSDSDLSTGPRVYRREEGLGVGPGGRQAPRPRRSGATEAAKAEINEGSDLFRGFCEISEGPTPPFSGQASFNGGGHVGAPGGRGKPAAGRPGEDPEVPTCAADEVHWRARQPQGGPVRKSADRHVCRSRLSFGRARP
jgi:hypothetical protein